MIIIQWSKCSRSSCKIYAQVYDGSKMVSLVYKFYRSSGAVCRKTNKQQKQQKAIPPKHIKKKKITEMLLSILNSYHMQAYFLGK